MKLVLAVLVLFASLTYADSINIPGPLGFNGGLKGLVVDVPLTLVIELAVSLVYLYIRKLPKKILMSVVIANIISLTFLEFFPWNFGDNTSPYAVIFLLEILVVIFEAIVIFYMNKKEIKMEDALTMSFFNNFTSFILGDFIYIFLAVGTSHHPNDCTFPPGFTCVTNKLQAGTAKLYLVMEQDTGHNIKIFGVNCTQQTDTSVMAGGSYIYYYNSNSDINSGNDNIILASRSNATVADGANISGSGYPATSSALICSLANGSVPGDTEVGSMYFGKIYINYTELDTGLHRIVVGTYSARYET